MSQKRSERFAWFASTAAALLALVTPPPAQAIGGLRFLEFNMCGAVAGTNCNAMSTSARIDEIVGEVQAWDADLLFLNEVCHSQWLALRADSRMASYEDVWVANRGSVEQCGASDQLFGIALFGKVLDQSTREAFDLGFSEDTEGSNARWYYLLCASVTIDGNNLATKACVTHLRSGEDASSVVGRGAQVAGIADIVNGWINQGTATVVGGDFNVYPPDDPALSVIYSHSTGQGEFQEADENDATYFSSTSACEYDSSIPPQKIRCRSGEKTFTGALESRKLDYIFLSAAHFRAVYGDALAREPGAQSDHHYYRGAASWQ